MKVALRLIAVAVATVFSVSARSADLPSNTMAPVAPVFTAYDWTGFYVGAQAGYGWARQRRETVIGFVNSYSSDGFVAGAHAGYNYQAGQVVLGAEADFLYGDIKGDDGGAGGSTDQTKIRWTGSLRGRVGFAIDRLMVFATGGWAFADVTHQTSVFGFNETAATTINGWTIGAGLEYAISGNWLLRAEYRYADLGKYNREGTFFSLPFSVDNKLHTTRVGVSYKF